MISSIFGKTKPISTILLLSFLFVLYWTAHIFLFKTVFSTNSIFAHVGILAVLLLSLTVVNFIVSKNKITETNSYAILLYCLFIVVFPETLAHGSIVFCSLFLLFGLRRLISIKSLQDVKSKIFDASFWIAISSLFYDWALLFLILVYIAIYLYEPKNFRNWLVAPVALFAFGMILWAMTLITGNEDYINNHYSFMVDFNQNFWVDWRGNAKFILYIFTVIFTGIYAMLKIGKVGSGRIVTLRFLGIAFGIGLLSTLIGSRFGIAPILFTFLPVAVFFTNYFESIKREKIREILLFLSVTVPIIVLIIHFVQV